METPSNPRLTKAIEAVREASGEELATLLRALLEELAASTLIAGRDGEMLTVETEDGDSMLALFTDLIELHFFEAGCPWVPISAEEAIRAVAEGEFDGLIINPGVRQLELPREDVLGFFEIDPGD